LKTNSWPGDELDAKLSFNVTGEPQLAFRNISGLKPGKMVTLFRSHGDSNDFSLQMADTFNVNFTLGNEYYTLRTSKGLTKDGTKVAVLVLESNDITQVIKQIYHSDRDDKDIIGNLLWAGDMDGDGKLDLYFDEFNEKGGTLTELHLSSQAESDDLVKKVADFGLAGC